MTTVKLERWRGHVVAARKQGIALSRYAREHGISPHTLYAAQRQMRSDDDLPVKRSTRRKRGMATPFIAVQVGEPPPSLVLVRLANGVELQFGRLDAGVCATLVAMLAALPCSG